MKNIRTTLLSVGAFGLAPVIVSLASIIAVPIMIRQLGFSIWLSVAVGQAAGELARSTIIWGWNSVGLAKVSSYSDEERLSYYFRSLSPRILLFALVSMLILGSTFLIPLESTSAYLYMAFAGAVLGLSGSWMFVGAREPKNLLMMDSVPRALAIAVGTLGLVFTSSIHIYGISVILGNFLTTLLPFLLFRGRAQKTEVSFAGMGLFSALEELRQGWSAFVIGIVLAGRLSLPLLVANSLVPSSAASIALADKFLRWGNTAMTPIMQYVQTGIPRILGSKKEKARKGTLRVFILSLGVVVIAALVTFFGAPLVSGSEIEIDFLLSAMVGLVLGLIFTSTVTGNSTLTMFGKTGTVAKGASIGMVAMLAMIVPLGLTLGALGIMLAYIVAELGIVCFQLWVLLGQLKKKPKHMA